MTTAKPITVFVCGPALQGELLTGLSMRNGAVVWEGGAEPAPLPVEPILAEYRVSMGVGLIILETQVGVYLVLDNEVE